MGQVKPLLSGFLPLFAVVILVFVVADEGDVEVGERVVADADGAGRQAVSRPQLGVPGVDLGLAVTLGSHGDGPPRLPPRLGEKRMPRVRSLEGFNGVQIVLSGNKTFSDRKIFEAIDLPAKPASKLPKATVRANIRSFYRRQGFAQARVTISTSSQTPNLFEVEIREGERFYYGGLELRGAFSRVVRHPEHLYPPTGSIVNWTELRQADARLRQEYLERGFLEVRINPIARLESTKKKLTYRIRVEEGSQYRVGSVTVPSALAALLPMSSGDVFAPSLLDRFVRDSGVSQDRVLVERNPRDALADITVLE